MATTTSSDREVHKRIEATLFASGEKLTVEDLQKLTRIKDAELILCALKDLETEYSLKDSSLHLVSDGNNWKFHVRPKYLSIARRLGVKTELTKTVIETLAIVAWRAPVKQSDIIAIRTNKAYDHLDELEQQGFISRSRFGRTRLIKLGKRFFDYFELDEAMMKAMMSRTVEKAESAAVKMKKRPGEEDALPSVALPVAEKSPLQASSPSPAIGETNLPVEVKETPIVAVKGTPVLSTLPHDLPLASIPPLPPPSPPAPIDAIDPRDVDPNETKPLSELFLPKKKK